MDKDVKKELKRRGWTCLRTQGHNTVWTNGAFKVSVSSTPLGGRATKNVLAEIRRADEAKEQGLSARDDPRLIRGPGVKVDVSPEAPSEEPEEDDEEALFDWTAQPWAREILAQQAILEEESVNEEDDKEKKVTLYRGIDPDEPFSAKALAPKVHLSVSGVGYAASAGSTTMTGFRILKFPATDEVRQKIEGSARYAFHAVPPDEADTWEALLMERYGLQAPAAEAESAGDAAESAGDEQRDASRTWGDDGAAETRAKLSALDRDNKLLRARLEELTSALNAAREDRDTLKSAFDRVSKENDTLTGLLATAEAGSPEVVTLCRELVDVPDEHIEGDYAKVSIVTLFKLLRALAKR